MRVSFLNFNSYVKHFNMKLISKQEYFVQLFLKVSKQNLNNQILLKRVYLNLFLYSGINTA